MKALSGAAATILGLAGANWLIEKNLLLPILLAAAVLVVAFLVVFGPRERGQTTTSPAPVGGRPRSGSPGRAFPRGRARVVRAARRRLPTL